MAEERCDRLRRRSNRGMQSRQHARLSDPFCRRQRWLPIQQVSARCRRQARSWRSITAAWQGGKLTVTAPLCSASPCRSAKDRTLELEPPGTRTKRLQLRERSGRHRHLDDANLGGVLRAAVQPSATADKINLATACDAVRSRCSGAICCAGLATIPHAPGTVPTIVLPRYGWNRVGLETFGQSDRVGPQPSRHLSQQRRL